MKKYLLSLLGGSFIPVALAGNIYALHINGINTTPSAAQLNLIALENAASSVTSYDNFVWNDIYNPTKSDKEWTLTAVADGAWETMMQKINTGTIDQNFTNYTGQELQIMGLNYAPGTTAYKQFQDTILEAYQEQLLNNTGNNMSTVVDNFNRSIDYSSINQLLLNNAAIILLPHSQGNVYANGLYNYVMSEGFSPNKITIFGFGSPMPEELGVLDKSPDYYNYTGFTSQNSNYVTSKHDVVINYLSRLLPNGVLPANADIPIQLTIDPLGHDLSGIYLSNSTVDNKYSHFMDYNYQYFHNIY